MPDVWKIMGEQLYFVQHAFGVRVTAFVLMNNHFHLIIQTPQSNLDQAMRWFMLETSRSLISAGNRVNQTYGGRYFRSMITTDHYFLHAYKYVYWNPMRAGLAGNVLDYPYSTLPCVLGLQPLSFPVHDALLISSTEETLNWLARTPSPEHWVSVQKALRRRLFRLAKVNKVSHSLETLLL
jgi:putative transposase